MFLVLEFLSKNYDTSINSLKNYLEGTMGSRDEALESTLGEVIYQLVRDGIIVPGKGNEEDAEIKVIDLERIKADLLGLSAGMSELEVLV